MKSLLVTLACVIAYLTALGQDDSGSSKHSPADEKVIAIYEAFRENVIILEKILADEFLSMGSNGKSGLGNRWYSSKEKMCLIITLFSVMISKTSYSHTH